MDAPARQYTSRRQNQSFYTRISCVKVSGGATCWMSLSLSTDWCLKKIAVERTWPSFIRWDVLSIVRAWIARRRCLSAWSFTTTQSPPATSTCSNPSTTRRRWESPSQVSSRVPLTKPIWSELFLLNIYQTYLKTRTNIKQTRQNIKWVTSNYNGSRGVGMDVRPICLMWWPEFLAWRHEVVYKQRELFRIRVNDFCQLQKS